MVGIIACGAYIPLHRLGRKEMGQAWGIPAIQETLSETAEGIVARTEPLGYRAVPRARRAGHYLGLRRDGGLPGDLAERLGRERIYASVRGDALRITSHLYNTPGDVDRLIAVLSR